MSKKQFLNVELSYSLGDSVQNEYNFLQGSDSDFVVFDPESPQLILNSDDSQNYHPLAQNTYEQSILDHYPIEHLSQYENELNDYDDQQRQVQSQIQTKQLQSKQSIRQEQNGLFICQNSQLEFKCQLTSWQICDPQEIYTDQQASQSGLAYSMNYLNNEPLIQNSDGISQYIQYDDIIELIYDQDSNIIELKKQNELKAWNEQNKYKIESQEIKCKKQQKKNKGTAKLNKIITYQIEYCNENQVTKNINQDKYKKIVQRLQQRDGSNIQQKILFQNIIMDVIANKLSFEKHKKLLNNQEGQVQREIISLTIIQSLYNDFSEYQNQIKGLGQIENYIVLLIVKLAIYNFLYDENLLSEKQFQVIREDLQYFFTCISDRIMEQAKDFILNQKIFQLSCDIKNKITKKIMNQLCIHRQYYKSNQSGYSNYIKQSKQVVKNEEYISFNEKKDKSKPGFFGKKNFRDFIKNDAGTIKDFTINHHYSLLNQNQGKIEKLSIYMDDIFNLLILFEDLRGNNDFI